MARSYPKELRERVVRAWEREAGLSYSELGERFDIDRRTVSRYLARVQAGLPLMPAPSAGAPPKLLEEHRKWLAEQLRANPTQSSYELTASFCKAFPACPVHRSTILRALHELGFTQKKRRRSRRNVNEKK